HLEALKFLKNKLLVVMCGEICEDDLDFELKSLINISTLLNYEDKAFWSKLHISLPSSTKKMSNQCFISDSNYITKNSATPSHSIKQNVSLVPTIMMSQPVKRNNHYHSHNHHHHSNNLHQNQQPSIDFSDSDKTFLSMETAQSSLTPSLNHSYMSIDYSQTRKSHIYDSIDDSSNSPPPLIQTSTAPPLIQPSSLPSVHTLHQHIRQQQQQQQQHPQQQNNQLSEELLILQQQQQHHRPYHTPISAPPGFAEPAVSASHFI
ncbi:unnamed protein product, partial [Meganyctiphanes norvegica]